MPAHPTQVVVLTPGANRRTPGLSTGFREAAGRRTLWGMASIEDVRRLALALPETEERAGRHGLPEWRVRGRLFAWERPLGRADLVALGPSAPAGVVLGVSVADLGVKEALLAGEPGALFTTPHFDGYAAVLVHLDEVEPDLLAELVSDAWLARAPKRLAAAHLADG